MIVFESIITCPKCNYYMKEKMPDDACVRFFKCKGCGEMLIPLAGDCCVFCSYGNVPCPPVQKREKTE